MNKWECVDLESKITIEAFQILFERLDKKLIYEEVNKLAININIKENKL